MNERLRVDPGQLLRMSNIHGVPEYLLISFAWILTAIAADGMHFVTRIYQSGQQETSNDTGRPGDNDFGRRYKIRH